jgi:hypothetical protein
MAINVVKCVKSFGFSLSVVKVKVQWLCGHTFVLESSGGQSLQIIIAPYEVELPVLLHSERNYNRHYPQSYYNTCITS